jgi:hypothetical protein
MSINKYISGPQRPPGTQPSAGAAAFEQKLSGRLAAVTRAQQADALEEENKNLRSENERLKAQNGELLVKLADAERKAPAATETASLNEDQLWAEYSRIEDPRDRRAFYLQHEAILGR